MVRLRRESTQVAPSFSQVTLRLGMGHKPLAFTDVLLFCRGYLIAAPSVFRSGVEEAISVTIFNSPREVMVRLSWWPWARQWRRAKEPSRVGPWGA